MTENRRQARARLDIYLNKYISGTPYMTRSSDISRGGLGLSHLIEPQHDAKRVGLQFQLPGSEEVIYAEGEIVREWTSLPAKATSKEHERSGIRFTLITERHRRLIDAYVEANRWADE